jgi:pimeloyl-ACP methyl ester carboxylesterase
MAKLTKIENKFVNIFKLKASVITPQHWQQRVGSQRDWIWRGWQTRYTYIRPTQPTPKTTPLILLHGFGTSIGHWRQNLAVLGEHHTVYALDMLGFGASEKASVSYKVNLWVEQVYDFWRTFVRQPVVLVGNSIGSLISLAAAAAHPDMVQGVVMLSLPDPSVREEIIPKFLRPAVATLENFVASPILIKTLFRVVRRPGMVRRWAGLAYANSKAVTDELVDILVGPAQDRGSAQAFCAILKAMTSAQFGPSVKAVLPTLKLPMLLIWGQQDRMVPPVFADHFASYNPNLQLLKLDNAGHCPHDECPEEVNQAILDWIEGWLIATNGSVMPLANSVVC